MPFQPVILLDVRYFAKPNVLLDFDSELYIHKSLENAGIYFKKVIPFTASQLAA